MGFTRGFVRTLLRGFKRGFGVSLSGLQALGVALGIPAVADTTNQNAYTLGTISLGPYELGLVFVVQTATTANGVSSFTGTFPGTWTLVAERAISGIRIQLFRTMSAVPGSGTVIANFAGGDVTTGCQSGGVKVANARSSGVNGADAIEQSNNASVGAAQSAVVSVPNPLRAGSVMVYCINHSAQEGTAPGTFTELGDASMATPTHGIMFAWGRVASDTPTWATSSASRWVAVEVRQP